MCSICKINCDGCGFKDKCKGCAATCGNPFGGKCVAAEYISVGGTDNFEAFKKELTDEINALGIPGMPKIDGLFSLAGFYVNLAYPTPSGETVKLLRDDRVYLGNQVCSEFDDGTGERCFGIVCDRDFILVAEYGENGSNPELVMFKRR